MEHKNLKFINFPSCHAHETWIFRIRRSFIRLMAFLKSRITPRGKISQKLHLFCPEFRREPYTLSVQVYRMILNRRKKKWKNILARKMKTNYIVSFWSIDLPTGTEMILAIPEVQETPSTPKPKMRVRPRVMWTTHAKSIYAFSSCIYFIY